MFKESFLLFLLAHLLADFYLQTEKLASRKDDSLCWLLGHGLCYWLTFLGLSVFIWTKGFVCYASLAALLHVLFDVAKNLYGRLKQKRGEFSAGLEIRLFAWDQGLHLISLAGLALVLSQSAASLFWRPFVERGVGAMGMAPSVLLGWVVVLLLVWKPANLAIARTLSLYRPQNRLGPSVEDKGAGRLIGILERVIIVLLVAFESYAAIGLVLTAKSIYRYDKIVKEPDFSEYYLIGTLLSTLVAVLASLLLV